MTSFSVDLRQQNLKVTVDENIEKDPNETYNAFFDKFSHTRDSHMPLVEKKFNRKKDFINDWVTPAILKSVNKKNRLYAAYRRLPETDTKQAEAVQYFKAYENQRYKVIRARKVL